jgi:hypothetical protein
MDVARISGLNLYVRLPNGSIMTIAGYAAAWRKMRSIPGDVAVSGWKEVPIKARVVLRDLLAGLHSRINERGNYLVPTSRVGVGGWSVAHTPFVRIEPRDGRRFPPAARRALAQRIQRYEH